MIDFYIVQFLKEYKQVGDTNSLPCKVILKDNFCYVFPPKEACYCFIRLENFT